MKTNILLAYIGLSIIGGTLALAIKVGVSSFPPLWFTGIRFFLGGMILFAYIYWRKIPLPTGIKDYFPLFYLGLLMVTLGSGPVTWGSQYIPSGLVALTLSSTPLWLTLIILLGFHSQRVYHWELIGIIIGFIGIKIVVGPVFGTLYLHTLKGVAAITLACITWSIGSLYIVQLGKRYHPLTITTFELLFGGFVLMVMACFVEPFTFRQVSLIGWLAFLYLLIFGTTISLVLYTYIISRASPTWASTSGYLSLLIAVILGWQVLHEPMTLNVWLGTLVVLLGMGMVNWQEWNRERKTSNEGVG